MKSPLMYGYPTLCVCVLLAFTSGGCSEPSAASTDSGEATTVSQANESEAGEETNAAEGDGDKVLRHAVFFSFKESSTQQDIQQVIDAFAALPAKIETITDFEWGTNNSPEGFSDGFTHCFLLTFENEQGRETYLPHPAHVGEFADALRPHMKDVFVFDYWATPGQADIERPLRHAVFFKFKDDASQRDIDKVVKDFTELPSKIDSIKNFEWGTNNSPEKKNDGFTHAFLVTFASEKGRDEYLPHPEHEAFVEILMPVLDKVRVLDYFAETE